MSSVFLGPSGPDLPQDCGARFGERGEATRCESMSDGSEGPGQRGLCGWLCCRDEDVVPRGPSLSFPQDDLGSRKGQAQTRN